MFRLSLILVTAIFFASGCGSANRNEGRSPRADSTQDLHIPQNPDNALSPHVARVEAEVLDCLEEETFFVCALRVEQVHERGASVPPLREGSEIEVRLYRSSLESAGGRPWSSGRRVDVTLHVLYPAGPAEPLWFVEIIH